MGSVRYAGDDGEWYSRGATARGDVITYAYFGTGHDFPADSQVPLTAVAATMRDLLATAGRRPSSVDWQPATR